MTNLALVPNNGFVAPRFIEELGCEGLTLHEVAKSLEIQFCHAKENLMKNIKHYSGIEVSIPSSNPVNPITKSYVLSTDDAKLFVSSYQNDIGFAYRKFLIQCEKALLTPKPIKLPTPVEFAKLLLASAEREEHLTQALQTSQSKNSLLTREVKKLRLNLQGKNEFMSISQWKAALRIKSKKNTNSLVRDLKLQGKDNYELRMLGECDFPTACFKVEFLEEQAVFIDNYFEI